MQIHEYTIHEIFKNCKALIGVANMLANAISTGGQIPELLFPANALASSLGNCVYIF